MRAITYQGMKHVEVKNVADPKIVKDDDIIGHEAMGIVQETLH